MYDSVAAPVPPEQDREDAFKARMSDQCREIRNYRNSVLLTEGRWISLDEAAAEWIARFAASYARRHDSIA